MADSNFCAKCGLTDDRVLFCSQCVKDLDAELAALRETIAAVYKAARSGGDHHWHVSRKAIIAACEAAIPELKGTP